MIHMFVVVAVVSRPVEDCVLDGAASPVCIEESDQWAGVVSFVRPQSVVTTSDTDTGTHHKNSKKCPVHPVEASIDPVIRDEDCG